MYEQLRVVILALDVTFAVETFGVRLEDVFARTRVGLVESAHACGRRESLQLKMFGDSTRE